MTFALIVVAVLAVLCVLYVARPFLRDPGSQDVLAQPDALEFDHRTGKLSDEDYRALVGPLRRRAAEAARALEPRGEERQRERAAR